jgi:hypothetical protein
MRNRNPVNEMNRRKIQVFGIGATIATLVLLIAIAPTASSQAKEDEPQTKLRIEITAGDKSVPVDMASIYVRYVISDNSKELKDKKFELNLKSNREGIASLPHVPRGKVTIQVIAPGWKTYGQVFELISDEQTVKIHLEKPPVWY